MLKFVVVVIATDKCEFNFRHNSGVNIDRAQLLINNVILSNSCILYK